MAAVDGVEDPDASVSLPPLDSLDFIQLSIAPSARSVAVAGLLIGELHEANCAFHATVCDTDQTPSTTNEGTHIGIDVPVSGIELTTQTLIDTLSSRNQSIATDYRHAVIDIACGQERPLGDDLVLGLVGDECISGLAGTTMIHGPFSGDSDKVREWLGEEMDTADRHDRSAIVIATLQSQPHPAMASAITRLMSATPTPSGPCATDVGTYDLLDVLASCQPGLALAVTVGQNAIYGEATRTWEECTRTIHDTVRTIERDQQVIRVDPKAPVAAIARLAQIVTPAVDPILVTDGEQIAVASSSDAISVVMDSLTQQLAYPIMHGDNRISGWPTVELGEIERTIGEVQT